MEKLNNHKNRFSMISDSIFALSLLRRNARLKYYGYVVSGLIISFLDLIAIAFLSLTISMISSQQDVSQSRFIGQFLSISDLFHLNPAGSDIYLYLLVVACAILFLKTLVSTVIQYRTAAFLSKQQVTVSNDFIRKFFGGTQEKIEAVPSQEVSFVLNHGVYYLINASLLAMSGIVIEFFLLLGIFLLLTIFYPFISISLFIFYTVVLGITFRKMATRAFSFGEKATSSYLESLMLIQESIRLHRELKVSHRHHNFNRLILDKIEKTSYGYSMQNFLSQVPKSIFEGALVIGLLVLTALVFGLGPKENAISTISIFLVSGLRLAPSLIKFQGSFITLKNLQPNISRVRVFWLEHIGVLSSRPAIDESTKSDSSDRSLTGSLINFVPTLNLQNVSYSYPNETHLVLNNVSFEIKEGSTVAIVGATGSGKSTLADICLGLRVPNSGIVEIGGVPAVLAPTVWPGKLAYFSQQVVLINGSVAENIALGLNADEIDLERVSELIKFVGLDQEIQTRSLGLHEVIGEDGGKLSGGQRQRLGLARALYSDPSLLFLDEVTSSQDPAMERFLIEFLTRLKGTRTIVLISHKSNSIQMCDSIIELRNEKVHISFT